MAATIKFKRGASDNVSLAAGEPAFNTADSKFFIGTNGTNKTWVGAEIKNNAGTTWTSGGVSDTQLATQTSIWNYVEGRARTKVETSEGKGSTTFDIPFLSGATGTTSATTIVYDSKTDDPLRDGFKYNPSEEKLKVKNVDLSGDLRLVGAGPSGTGGTSTGRIVDSSGFPILSMVGNIPTISSSVSSLKLPPVVMANHPSTVWLFDRGNVTDPSTGVSEVYFGRQSKRHLGSYNGATIYMGTVVAQDALKIGDLGTGGAGGSVTFKTADNAVNDIVLTFPDAYPQGKGDGSGTRPLVSDENGNLSWGEFNSETTTFNIADSSDSSAELNLVLTTTTAAGQGSALIDIAAGTSGQDGGIKYNPSTNTLTTSVFRVREGTTGEYISIDAPQSTTSYAFTLPTTGGTADYVLKTDGSGNTSWTDVIEKANTVFVTDTPGASNTKYYPAFYEDSENGTSYATRVDEAGYEVNPTRNRFTLKTGLIGSSGGTAWQTCSNPMPNGTCAGSFDGSDTPAQGVGNFGVGELEFSARSTTNPNTETGYLRFGIDPALTEHVSYVLPNTVPVPGQFLGVATYSGQDSDGGDAIKLEWATSAGEVNVAAADPDSSYNAAYSLVFAQGGSGGAKGLLFDLDNDDGGLSWNPSSNVLKAGRVQLDTGITESGGGTTTGAISLEPISSATSANVNLFASTTGTITLGASSAVVLVPSISVGSSDNAAVNKAYVDGVAAGIHFHAACRLATAGVLPNCTYSKADNTNNANGIGDYLQATGTGALSVDSVAVAVGDRILVKDQANSAHNGIYTVTATGGASAQWKLTRAEDFDTDVEIAGGDFTFVTAGATNANSGWVQTGTSHTSIGGSSAITFVQFAGAANYTASNGIRRDVNEFKLASAANADTNLTAGRVLYGNGSYVTSLPNPASGSGQVLSWNGSDAPQWTTQADLIAGKADKLKQNTATDNNSYYLTFAANSTDNEYNVARVNSNLVYNPSGTYTAGTLTVTNKHVLSIASGDGYLDAIIDGGTYN